MAEVAEVAVEQGNLPPGDIHQHVEVDRGVVETAVFEAGREIPAGFRFGKGMERRGAPGRRISFFRRAAGTPHTAVRIELLNRRRVGIAAVMVEAAGSAAVVIPEGHLLFQPGDRAGQPLPVVREFAGDQFDHRGEEGRLGTVQMERAVPCRHKAIGFHLVEQVFTVVPGLFGKAVQHQSPAGEVGVPVVELLKRRPGAGNAIGMGQAEQGALGGAVDAGRFRPAPFDEVENLLHILPPG